MHSPHNADVLSSKLQESFEPQKLRFWPWTSKHKPYQGKIQGDIFFATRIIHYGNSLLPRIKGQINRSFPGCSVTITMTLHPLVAAFLAIWSGGIALVFATVASSALLGASQPSEGSPTNPIGLLLIPTGMILYGYALAIIGFKVEASKSKAFFKRLFEADKLEHASLQEILAAQQLTSADAASPLEGNVLLPVV